ncbi:MAG: SMC-Scp complex subunit ScpB [Nitrospiria bacterium]
MEIHELKQIIESLLFVATEPLPIEKIKDVTGAEKKSILMALQEIKEHYRSENHGLQIVEIAGGFQMVTLSENSPWIKKFLTVKTTGRLSKPGLETLAIIAYKQPIIRTEMETIRGVDCGGVIKTLLERRLVKIVGRKELPGKPMLYGTTREFLEYFGLNNLSELPTLKEFKETTFPVSEPEFIDSPSQPQLVQDTEFKMASPQFQGKSVPETEALIPSDTDEPSVPEVEVLIDRGN